MKSALTLVAAAALLVPGAGAVAQRQSGLRPSEQVWKPAPTPQGGVSWQTLESTKENTRTQAGVIYSKPVFPPQVRALSGKRIKVNGYIMPLQNSAKQTHFVLLAYPPDCPFHLNPVPNQFIEVRAAAPVSVASGVQTIEGTLELTGTDESGIFYRLKNSRAV